MPPLAIWITSCVLYAIFWIWYVGFGRKIKPEEIDTTFDLIKSKGNPREQLLADLRNSLSKMMAKILLW